MEKTHRLLLLIAAAIIATILFISMSKWIGEDGFKNTEEVDLKYLESIQLHPPEDYIQGLISIVENNDTDPYIRERAIFTLTNIAIRKHETGDIIDFLKEVAINEKEDNVRTAAYANIDLIRDIYPLEKKGHLDISISGDIKKNTNISLIAKISSKVDIKKAVIGIDRLHINIDPLSPIHHEVDLKANEPKEVQFYLHLKETGEYEIPVTLMLSFDRIDYEMITDEIQINVGEFEGSFTRYLDQSLTQT